MGTRADFYVGRGPDAEWLGSIAWDGYPDGIPEWVVNAVDEAEYRRAVESLSGRDDWTAPAMGWPWPWEDSRTTDYAYAFDGGQVHGSCFGHAWFLANAPEPDHTDCSLADAQCEPIFPDMTSREVRAVPGTSRSGLIAIELPDGVL